ncbi:unnamed protein product [Cyprideis torosa]|uniref:Uncharacterized protein n=1 Tax=Cyprideis torosa TaxID=163714 RepID=A0A7R8WIK7_9CRUS|nr:unnamed protein product [Cyprideis torosa]CAG0894931.1 unnamed protein product [Cyprideis torosa]
MQIQTQSLGRPTAIMKFFELAFSAACLGLYIAEPIGMPTANSGTNTGSLNQSFNYFHWDRFYVSIFAAYLFIPAAYLLTYAEGKPSRLSEIAMNSMAFCFFIMAGVSILIYATRDNSNNSGSTTGTVTDRMRLFAKIYGSFSIINAGMFAIDQILNFTNK